ncbi:MAG TPA: thioredoxin domain-containing protein [Myxococcota bacterium]|nr:thioredoxin domain-containing protein [Myxococcota bacterium]HQK51723.1 thioredoxin domain-containing protein [Myxococcota bacterium]
MRRIVLVLSVLATGFVPLLARADGPCEGLSASQRAVADQVLASQHPYDACDGTFVECLKARPVAPLVRRLADWVCRKAAAGQDAAAITRSLEKRALSMLRPGKTVTMDLSAAPVAGCTEARVTVTAYLCARCPYCARLVPALHREVTSGRLAGRVALRFRLFPIKSHEHSTEANVAVAAAMSLGKGWEYLLRAYRGIDAFSTSVLSDWAADVGLDRGAFQAAQDSPATREAVVASKKEGLRNGVESTPTIFINGRRWLGDLDLDTLVDALEEEVEALR